MERDSAPADTDTPTNPRRRSRWRYVLLVAVAVGVMAGIAATVVLVRSARNSEELSFFGFVVSSAFEKECGTVRGGADDEHVVLDYMANDFMGPGDGYTTSPLRRDVLTPRLRDGEEVAFDLEGDKAEDVERGRCD